MGGNDAHGYRTVFSWCISRCVNSSPTSFFSNSYGLRQTGLLSPFLFAIVMDVLGRMISIAVSGGLLSCFSMWTWTNIAYLLFTDDIFLFYEANPNHLCNLRSLFLCFEVVLGLKMNLTKLELVPMGNVNNVVGVAKILGCGFTSLPMKYLGLPAPYPTYLCTSCPSFLYL